METITLGDLEKLRNGDSNFSLPKSIEIQVVMEGPSNEFRFTLHQNSAARLGAIEFVLKAEELDAANVIAGNAFNQLSATLSVAYLIPLLRHNYIVKSESRDEYVTGVYSHYPDVALEHAQFTYHGALDTTIKMFGEGIRANSPFYSFLCFFKVTDFILAKAAPRLRRLKDKYGSEWIEPMANLPEEPTRFLQKDLVGKKITQVRDLFYKEMRIAVAHMDYDSGLTPFDMKDERRVALASSLLKLIASDLIGILGTNLMSLTNAGCPYNEIHSSMQEP